MTVEELKSEEKVEKSTKRPDVAFWVKEIADAKKREKKFRRLARRAERIYDAEEAERSPYNILYANTETLSAALYNSTPRPVALPKNKRQDPTQLAAAELLTSYLVSFLDSNSQEDTTFDTMMAGVLRSGLVPGRGVSRFRFEAAVPAEGEPGGPTNERIIPTLIPWNRVYFGYALVWSDVPWVGFEHFMTQAELIRNFGEETAVQVSLTSRETSDEGEDGEGKDSDETMTMARVLEIWDKETKLVHFLCPDSPDVVLRENISDPLGLSGFFPMPEPLVFGRKIRGLIPVPLYAYYEEQAKELNNITLRINAIVKALRVRGFFDSTIEGIDKVLEAEDNTLLPAGGVMALAQGATLDRAIWLMPLEKLVQVLQQLYLQRAQVKQIIHDITAIADIMRGDTKASETLGAQQIKSQWGGLRLRNLQAAVATYARDSLRIVAEIAFHKIGAETLRQVTESRLPLQAEQAQIQQAVQMQMQQAQMAGQPPPPVPPGMQEILNSPTWEAALGLLQTDIQRKYAIDLETNSTIEQELLEDKQEIGELLHALAQFFTGIMPLVETGQLPYDAMKSMLRAVIRRYRLGGDVEKSLEAMRPPPPKPPEDGGKRKAEGMKAEVSLKVEQAKADLEMKRMEREERLAQVKEGVEVRKLQREERLADAKISAALRKLTQDAQLREVANAAV